MYLCRAPTLLPCPGQPWSTLYLLARSVRQFERTVPVARVVLGGARLPLCELREGRGLTSLRGVRARRGVGGGPLALRSGRLQARGLLGRGRGLRRQLRLQLLGTRLQRTRPGLSPGG